MHDACLGLDALQRRCLATTACFGGRPNRRAGQLLPRGVSDAEKRVPYRSPGCWTDRKSAFSPGAKAGPVAAASQGSDANCDGFPRSGPVTGMRKTPAFLNAAYGPGALMCSAEMSVATHKSPRRSITRLSGCVNTWPVRAG